MSVYSYCIDSCQLKIALACMHILCVNIHKVLLNFKCNALPFIWRMRFWLVPDVVIGKVKCHTFSCHYDRYQSCSIRKVLCSSYTACLDWYTFNTNHSSAYAFYLNHPVAYTCHPNYPKQRSWKVGAMNNFKYKIQLCFVFQ